MPRRDTRSALLTAVAALALAVPARAASLDVPLTFGTLPSAQGFTYVATGAHAGVLESSVFSVSGGVFAQNTIGQSNGVSGGGLFYERTGGITTSEPKTYLVRARCTQVQGGSIFPAGQGGFAFMLATGSVQYGFTLTPTGIYVLSGSSWAAVAGSYDNTQFHDYRYAWSPGGLGTLYRDNVQIDSRVAGGSLVANRILFGDTTGGANAAGEISFFEFLQGGATASQGVTWGRLKALYRPAN